MATLGNAWAALYSRIFPNTKPHKGEVFAGANVAGPNTSGLAASAATGALGLVSSVLQMKMLNESDNYYLDKIIKKAEELEREGKLQKDLGLLIRKYSYAARLGPYLTHPEFLPFWLEMEKTTLLFRGTYSPKGRPDIWDPSYKAVIATTSNPYMADLFALKAFSNIYPSIEFTGHLYLLLVAPGVQYIDVKKQAIIPSLTGHIVHHYAPIFKSFVGPTIHEEDEYVLLSNRNVKIIFDSPLIPTATFKQHNEFFVPSVNYIIEHVLRDKKEPIHNTLTDIYVPAIFKEDPSLFPFERTVSFNPAKGQDYQVTNIQIHIALYGFDGIVGGSRSVTVIGAPPGSNLTYETQSNAFFIDHPDWEKISPTMMSPPAATVGGGAAVGGAGVGGAGASMTNTNEKNVEEVSNYTTVGATNTRNTRKNGGAGASMTNTNKKNVEEVSNYTTVGATNTRNTRKNGKNVLNNKKGPKTTLNNNIGNYRKAKREEDALRQTAKRKANAAKKRRGTGPTW